MITTPFWSFSTPTSSSMCLSSPINVTLHRISGIKVNAWARQNDTLDTVVFIAHLKQSHVFSQIKECAEFKKTKKPCKMTQWQVKWHASKMTHQQNDSLVMSIMKFFDFIFMLTRNTVANYQRSKSHAPSFHNQTKI